MNQSNRRRPGVLYGTLTAVFAVLLVPLTAWADDEEGEIEEIVVTGSLIKKDNFDSASPLQVLDDMDIQAEATPALGEIIYNQTFNYGSDVFASHYSVTNPEGNRTGADFRGLGATLTLLDGGRVTDGNLNNLIPQIAIARIDILKDGASAIYGSDAVAGVINVIPKKNVQGAEIGYFFQMDSEGDHEEYVANFLIGDQTDRGYFTFAVENREKTALFQTERAEQITNRSVSSSGTGNPGSYNVPIRDEFGGITGVSQLADPGCGVAASPGGNGPSVVGNYRNNISGRLGGGGSVCRFEFGEFFNFVTPNRVFNTYLNYEYQITDKLTYDGSLIYSRQKTQSRGSPTNPGGRIRDINILLGGVSGDHPGNPYTAFYDRNGNGLIDPAAADMELLYAMDANGDGVPDRGTDGSVILAADPYDPTMGISFNEDVQIAALRLFGKLGTLPSNLDASGANLGYATYDVDTVRFAQNFTYQMDNGWEAALNLVRMQNKDARFRKNGSFRAVLLGLQGELGPAPGVPFAPGNTDQALQYYNPFSTSALNCQNRVCTDPGAANNPNLGDFPNTQFVADSIDINAIRLLKTSLTNFRFTATGDLVDGWAGTVSAAFGAEYQKFVFDWDARSDENQCNNWYDACSADYTAEDKYSALFYEFAVPVLDNENWGFAELQIAGRYSDYSGIGSSFDPKYAVLWQPTNWLAIRASRSEAFIAPSIPQRFEPGSSFLQSTNDPLRNDFENTYRTNSFSGNPDLKPETADITNIGFSLSLLDGDLNFGFDYSNYDFIDRITLLRGPRIVGQDFAAFLAAYPQPLCGVCQTGQTYEVSETDALAWISQQDPAIVRGGAPSYTIVEVEAYYLNANQMEHTAFDVYADYTLSTDALGMFRLGIQATQIDEYTFDFGGGNTGDANGQQNLGIDVIPPLPELRMVGTLNWNMGNNAVLLRARWSDEVDASFSGQVLEDLTYIDLTYTYQGHGWTDSDSITTIEVGARNLTDEYPTPDGAFGAGIELSLHDPRGRMFFARLKHEF